MIIEIDKIKTKFWQHKAGTVGEVVCDLDDIGQCYETIIGLSKGDVPLQPNLGADIIKAIGENPIDADKIIRALLLTELPIQEPRGKILDIKTSADVKGKIIITLKYKSILATESETKIKEIKL